MSNKPLISTIIPVYGAEEFLPKCFDSILQQTHTNIELILVDDGSPGRSPEICDEYAAMDSRVKVIHKKNGGGAEACNAGLDVATGDYLSFIDCDDYLDLSFYEIMLEMICTTGADMSVCSYYHVDEQGNDLNEASPILCDEVITPKEFISRLTEPMSGFYITRWNRLYSKSVFDGVRFNVNPIYKTQNEDNWIIPKVLDQCSKIAITSKQLVFYTQRGDSMSRTMSIADKYNNIEAICQRIDYCAEKGYTDLIAANLEAMVKLHIELRRHYLFHGSKTYKNVEASKRNNKIVTDIIRKYRQFASDDMIRHVKHSNLYIVKDIISERLSKND